MDVEIVSVHGHGTANDEFVLMRVTANTNMNRYIVIDTTYTKENKIANVWRHPYWSGGNYPLKKGDYVVLHTKDGEEKTVTRDGNVYHHFYWRLGSPVWNNDGDIAVLFELNDLKATSVR